jgi:hypothetical protein
MDNLIDIVFEADFIASRNRPVSAEAKNMVHAARLFFGLRDMKVFGAFSLYREALVVVLHILSQKSISLLIGRGNKVAPIIKEIG